MAVFSVSERTNALITASRGPCLYAAAAAGAVLREVGVFNTTATECRVGLRRATATGTQGTALNEVEWDANRNAPQCTAFNTHTADATLATGFIRNCVLPAAIGGGYIWTFGSEGLVIPEGTGNGIVITLPAGTAQHIDFYFDWEE